MDLTAEQIITQKLKSLEVEKAENARIRVQKQEEIKRLDAVDAHLNAGIKSMKAALKKLRRF